MSRSTRKPWYTDGYKGSKRRQFEKRHANKIVRKTTEIADGKAYRKFGDTWDICDYRFMYDPKPRIRASYLTGELQVIEPEPIWRVNRK